MAPVEATYQHYILRWTWVPLSATRNAAEGQGKAQEGFREGGHCDDHFQCEETCRLNFGRDVLSTTFHLSFVYRILSLFLRSYKMAIGTRACFEWTTNVTASPRCTLPDQKNLSGLLF